jgi:hypothetical protein
MNASLRFAILWCAIAFAAIAEGALTAARALVSKI